MEGIIDASKYDFKLNSLLFKTYSISPSLLNPSLVNLTLAKTMIQRDLADFASLYPLLPAHLQTEAFSIQAEICRLEGNSPPPSNTPSSSYSSSMHSSSRYSSAMHLTSRSLFRRSLFDGETLLGSTEALSCEQASLLIPTKLLICHTLLASCKFQLLWSFIENHSDVSSLLDQIPDCRDKLRDFISHRIQSTHSSISINPLLRALALSNDRGSTTILRQLRWDVRTTQGSTLCYVSEQALQTTHVF